MEDNERSRSIEQLPVPEESVMHVESAERSLKTHEIHISLGINISILVMLTIFGVLLFLPLRLLLNTTYYSRNQSIDGNDTGTMNATSFQTAVIPVDHRKLKRCPKLDYNEVLLSVFHCDYDTNCTYTPSSADDDATRNDVEEASKSNGNKSEVTEVSKETVEKNLTECTEDSGKDRRSKSVPVAGHILVTMLLISAIAALVEVLRIRFARDKDSSKAGIASSRNASTIEIPMQRGFIPRQPMNSQRSFEMQGARPPPLIRRSSFPSQPAKQTAGSVSGTPTNRMSRRQSAEAEEEIGVLINALHHRTRLIRRH
nr:uncharacterized protein LOC116428517 isoform X2 [Nomia melanderi]